MKPSNWHFARRETFATKAILDAFDNVVTGMSDETDSTTRISLHHLGPDVPKLTHIIALRPAIRNCRNWSCASRDVRAEMGYESPLRVHA